MFFDPAPRILLRTRPNPLTPAETARLRGARPAGPVPQPSAAPARIQRRISATGVVNGCRAEDRPSATSAGQTVTVLVSDTTLTVELGDEETRTIPRTTTPPVRSIKGQRPRAAAPMTGLTTGESAAGGN